MFRISSGIVAVLLLEAHDQVELLFALHHLGRHIAADGRLDQAVDVGDVQPIPGNPGAVDFDGEAGLPKLLDQRHVPDAAHLLQHVFDGPALLLQRVQVGAENFDGQGAFQSRFRFVHGVFRRLGVVEDDSGKDLRASC